MRYISTILDALSEDKFVFLTGPRQVGKTTLARAWLSERKSGNGAYLNWDIAPDRQAIREIFKTNTSPSSFLVLDEVHKHPRWKTALKGLFDGLFPRVHVVVTGSAKLDVYQRGGDSLFGRYDELRLHPFSVAELIRLETGQEAGWKTPLVMKTNGEETGIAPPGSPPESPPESPDDWLALSESHPKTEEIWARLEKRSGFPEPYLRDNDLAQRRWGLRRKNLVLRDEIRDLSQVKTIALVEELAGLLPARVGGLLSINSLREELQVAFDTAKSWIELLERLYYCYRVRPYSHRIARSLSKEAKLYLWDWTEVDLPAARFENMVGSHLLKAVHYWRDVGFGEFDLAYWRNREKKEVDFVVLLKKKPVVAIECKYSDTQPSDGLLRFGEAFPDLPLIQVVRTPGVNRISKRLRVTSASSFLGALV